MLLLLMELGFLVPVEFRGGSILHPKLGFKADAGFPLVFWGRVLECST
jgi:hypothetical protein